MMQDFAAVSGRVGLLCSMRGRWPFASSSLTLSRQRNCNHGEKQSRTLRGMYVGGWVGLAGLYASDDLCPLGLELCGVALVRLLFAVFETCALVVFQEPVLRAVVAVTEPTISDDPLRSSLALLECTARFNRHGGGWLVGCLFNSSLENRSVSR